jgi:hypothetical protein
LQNWYAVGMGDACELPLPKQTMNAKDEGFRLAGK